MEYYGNRGSTNKWIKSWLSGRTQQVVLDGQASDPVPVLSGVPQGSVLGPALFLIFINDLPDNIRSSVCLFADVYVLYRNIHKRQDCLILQEDLTSLGQWEADWQMKFNVAKCHSMRATRRQNHKHFNCPLLNQIEKGSSLKEFGGQQPAGRNTSSVGEMLDELEWPPLEAWRDKSSLLLFQFIVDQCLLKKDKYMTPAHSLKTTRSSHSAQYRRHQTYSDALKNSSPPPRTIPHWNSLSPPVANIQSTEEFRALLIETKIQPKVVVVFCWVFVFYFTKISKLALPGVMLKYQ